MRIQSPTASEVLAGVVLFGKTAIITGGHSGLGFESTKAFELKSPTTWTN